VETRKPGNQRVEDVTVRSAPPVCDRLALAAGDESSVMDQIAGFS
jgi:hypothetical protein